MSLTSTSTIFSNLDHIKPEGKLTFTVLITLKSGIQNHENSQYFRQNEPKYIHCH